MRKLYLVALSLGAALTGIPSLAAGSSAPGSASFTAVDYGWHAGGGPGTKATIAQGGSVSFSYPSGRSEHNADFGMGPHPTSCTQTTGAGSGRVPPLPHVPTGEGWMGSCEFQTPGIYKFHCDVHPFMTGTIVVEGPAGSPLAGRNAISIASHQRGTAVRGSIRLSSAATGGRLEVELRASAGSLGRRGSRPVVVGRLERSNLKPGTARFSAALGAAAKRAERRQGHLAVTVEVIVTPPGRGAASVTRPVQLISSA